MYPDILIRADLIREARIASGFSLREIAGYLNIDHVTVWRWEKGRNSPSLTNLRKFAIFTGHDVNDFIELREESNGTPSQPR